jgi:hypothetical protein
MSKKFSIAPLLYIPFLACGGGGTTHVTLDGHGSGSGSGSNVTCEALASYTPSFGSNNQDAVNVPATAGSGSSAGTTHQQYYLGGLDTANPGDYLDIELFAMFGAFGSGDIAPGTYALQGDEIDYNSCGTCVLLWPQLLVGSDGSLTGLTSDYISNHQYMATAGSITLTTVSGSNFAGSISGVQFKHVNYDASGTQTYPDACVSAIASASFSTSLRQAGSAAFVAEGTLDNGTPVRIHLGNRHR